MARRETSYELGIVLDEMRAQRNENNINMAAMRADMKAMADKMEEAADAAMEQAKLAHKRLDARENREKGILVGVGLGSGTFGALLAKYLPGVLS